MEFNLENPELARRLKHRAGRVRVTSYGDGKGP